MAGVLEEYRKPPCAIIPDITYVMTTVVGTMFFTYFVVPRAFPDFNTFTGQTNDEYRLLSSALHWMVLFATLNLYYPSNSRRYEKDYLVENNRIGRNVVTCAPNMVDLGSTIGNSMDPVSALLMFYMIIKILSFFFVTALRDATSETRQVVRLLSGIGEVIALWVYLTNYHEAAIRDVTRRAMHTPNNRHGNYRRRRRYGSGNHLYNSRYYNRYMY